MVVTNKITFGKDKYHLNKEMMEWCLNFIGVCNIGSLAADINPAWDMTTAFGNSTYYFKHEHDLILFSLRWV